MKEVHLMDRRDLSVWGMLNNEAFLKDYWEMRTFFEAGGRKQGQLDPGVLLQLAFKHRLPLEPETPAIPEPSVNSKPKKVLQPA